MMPSTRIAWRDVWTGSVVTALLFEVGKLAIGLYLGKSGLQQTFAAAGSLVVLIAWVYYAAQIFLLGAEFTKAYADAHGSLSVPGGAGSVAGADEPSRAAATPVPSRSAVPQAAVVMRGIDDSGTTTIATERDIDRRLDRATTRLARQLLVFGVVSASNYLLDRWTRRQRKSQRLRTAAHRAGSKPRRPA
jgi:membrane protein